MRSMKSDLNDQISAWTRREFVRFGVGVGVGVGGRLFDPIEQNTILAFAHEYRVRIFQHKYRAGVCTFRRHFDTLAIHYKINADRLSIGLHCVSSKG